MTYHAPIEDMMMALRSAAGLDAMIASGVAEGIDADLARAVIEEAGRFASEELEPLNAPGDRQGAHLIDGKVQLPDGWADAYARWCDGGWAALPGPTAFGGQHLPKPIAMAVGEIWNASNPSFGVGPLLSQGAVDAIAAGASDTLKATYLPKLVSGEWMGTMNLTEPQAGSDLNALRTRAERQGDGTYRIFGTKIYITYGEHELTPNILHLVLARLPDAPAGTRGISLFLVPKYLVDDAGAPTVRNDVTCVSLEHKLGLHASPTCVMAYGENDGAVGYLIGEENKGLAIMFIMMNAARLAVGVQGVAAADRATQRAIAYATDRKQGRAEATPTGEMAPIVEHPDIRRTLLTMRALTNAARLICMECAAAIDLSERASDPRARTNSAARAALLTPIAKAFSTDIGVEVASMGIQVHGGMGFIEDTGAAQILRDARIYPIYEGTNGIQAIDLVQRKLPLGDGEVVAGYLGELSDTIRELRAANAPGFGTMADDLEAALWSLRQATDWMMARQAEANQRAVLSGATPYLRLFGTTAGGVHLARTALAARSDLEALSGHVDLARFYAANIAVSAGGLARSVMAGSDAVMDAALDRLAG